jgi:uncharacterized membrane protein
MKTFFLAYVFFLVIMLAIDAVWLVTMSKRFYKPRIGELMADSPRVVPAVVFYLIYALGAALLVVVPAVNNDKGYLVVFLLGALLGLVAYGTYDLTNQATLKTWPTIVTAVDLAWGSLLTGVVSIISTALTRLVV